MPVPPAETAAAASRDDRREAAERREAPVDRRVGEDRRSPEGRPTPASLLNTLWEMPTVPEPEGFASPMPGSDLHDGDGPAQPTFLDAPARPAALWPCAVCDTPNPLERDTCMSCGEPFSRLFQEHEARPEVDPAKAARWSMAFPGLGHAVAGRKAEGVARGVLFAWCALTAILLLTAHAAGGLGILGPLAIVFVLGSAAWYAVTALDAYRLANGDRQVVTPRIMLYSVAGLMMLSVASVFIMVTRASHIAH